MKSSLPVAIITGAANNIGLACAKRFSKTHHVVMADIADASAEAKALPKAVYEKADVSDFEACCTLVDRARSYGRLEALVHCAAITKPARSIVEMDTAEWEQVIKVNLTGTFFLAKACIPAMTEHGGNMILFTSRAAKTGFAALGSNAGKTKAHYCASKAGVISLVKSLALELAEVGIRVNSVAPGPVSGSMIPPEQIALIAEKVPLRRVGSPEDMAEAAWFLCSREANFITGHVLDVNGGTLMD
ncbi:MAG: SDR family NAD(P)-dependent oxidoreductase [Desulfovibrio sp.]|uniref:SDR family NAD(P)-dependent oxidoreductase n=1 Tax=Desulfovibrio sp. TaxID=885 RepID=UPI0039E55C42